MSYNKKRYIVRDSKDSFYQFYLCNKNLILENSRIGQRVIRENILEYALDIDKSDKIHIIYLNIKGELRYIVCNNKMEEKNVFVVKDKYILKDLKLKVIDSSIHIFYQVDSLKEDRSAIYHNYLIGSNWVDEKLAETCCPRYICSYFVDCYEKDIYLLYCWNYDLGEYNIKKFDINKNIWEDFQSGILIKDSSSLNFFITPNYIGIICFSKFVDTNIQTFIKYKDFNDLSSKWSLDRNISNSNSNTLKPIIFYKDNYIYVAWKQENRIVYKKSKDILNWSRELILDLKSESIYELMYSNSDECANIKINCVYIPYIEFLYSLINSKIEYTYDSLSIESVNDNVLSLSDVKLSNESISSLQKKYSEFIEEKDKRIKSLINEIEEKDTEISRLRETNLILNNQIKCFQNSINEYETKLQNIKAEQVVNNQKYFIAASYYENEIKKLKEEKEKLLQDINNKIQSLLKIIAEKDEIIQRILRK